MKNTENYYLGLDVGTDSVGYAATDTQYDLLNFHGEPMWGVHLFEEASLNVERRGYRSARRRLDRRQQRVKLVQEIFAGEIAAVDENFYRRIKESALWREDAHDEYCIFADQDYDDVKYHKQYPTIHHLIVELMENSEPHDVRLVYLACAWLVVHRGHFLSDVSKDHIEDILNIGVSYRNLMELFTERQPWDCDPEAFGEVLKKKLGINAKYKELCKLLYNAPKAPKEEYIDEQLFNADSVLKLLCGGTVSAKELFGKEQYAEVPSIALNKDDGDLAQICAELGDDAELIQRLKAVFDWAVLADILEGEKYISAKKVAVYKQHKKDLALLKRLVRKYVPDQYNCVFRDDKKPGYASYINAGKAEDFCKYIKSIFKNTTPANEDAAAFEEMLAKLETRDFCPKQVTSDNRVIPYQVYWMELKQILDNASAHLPFLDQADEDGYTAKDKLLSIMEFRIPYFVGPLNSKSKNSWFMRRAEGKILPWNFNEKVDLERSEQAFIDKMTNTCTYLPGEDVLPKCSLLHEKFQVLNEINSLTVHGQRISVELKQKIYLDLFSSIKRVTVKAIKNYLKKNGFYTESDLDTLGGIDETIKSSLASHIAFKRLMDSAQLTWEDAEEIIKRSTYTEDRMRFAEWVNKTYPYLSENDRKYISKLKFKDFARLSKALLCELYGTETDSETGEASSIIERMWNENLNLMEILSERYTYRAYINDANDEYYRDNPRSLDERMNEMCISNAVKRPIIRTLDIVSDVVKANNCAPAKIFIEMARGGKPDEKGTCKKSRYQQLKELYAKCQMEDVREMESLLDAMGEDRDNLLQGDKLFLYYMQLGRSMYSGKPINIEQLSEKAYDIDHIYPQCKVKDDSVLNNKVLVLSEENGKKGDIYPIEASIRHQMHAWWKQLLDHEFITPEKYKRLTRHIPFDENEEWGFINRQLVETRQSTKALATLLKEKYPQTEIVYVKAGLVSEFRQEFDMLKSRAVNDLHHAKDAYLNVVVGNVYSEQFTHKWFVENRDTYNLKVSTLFSRCVTANKRVIWNGSQSLDKVKQIIHKKNAVHLTRYTFFRKGGFFNQQPESAAPELVPRKAELPTEKYGGYNNKSATAFILAGFKADNKKEVMLVTVELLSAVSMKDEQSIIEYCKNQIEQITGKTICDLEFPLGLRLIKLHTIFEFDGIRMAITGKSNKGKTVILSVTTPLIVGYPNELYIKHLEKYCERKKNYPNMKYSKYYDQISTEENEKLYEILLLKLQNSVFRYRPANPIDTLKNGTDAFAKLDIDTQAKVLLQIVALFGRSTNGCDLSAIEEGKSRTATPTLSSSLSNWKKYYTDVRIIDQPASGLFETRSINLLQLL